MNYTTHEPEIRKLIAQARKRLPTHLIDADDDRVDEIDDNGNRIRVLTDRGPGDTTIEREHDLTAMYAPAPSTTQDPDILRVEAALLADGVELENPHVPGTVQVKEEAERKIEADGNTPAWEELYG